MKRRHRDWETGGRGDEEIPPVSPSPRQKLFLHGYLGIAIILVSEFLLFSGNQFVGGWFTPIVWTGYVLLIDALVFKVKGRSLLVNDRLELLVIIIISIACWWLFEFYNAPRFWRSDLELWWHYHNLTANPFVRRVGYDWAFATIFPALFETAALFEATLFARRGPTVSIYLSKTILYSFVVFGAATALLPLVVISPWFAPLIWLSFIFLLDPINRWRGQPSIVGDLAEGKWGRLLSLLAGGAVCGLLWEFWNYWALSKWTYTVPYFGNVKLFEMPLPGYLGFPPFAVECWTMYIFLRSFLGSRKRGRLRQLSGIWFTGADI